MISDVHVQRSFRLRRRPDAERHKRHDRRRHLHPWRRPQTRVVGPSDARCVRHQRHRHPRLRGLCSLQGRKVCY